MKANEAIREIMNKTGTRISTLAKRLNTGTNTIANRVAREGITVAKLSDTIRAMDYKVVVIPSNARLPEGGIEVE